MAPISAAPPLLALAAALHRREGRAVAAAGLARALGSEALLMHVRDDEVGVLLPAPGFPQTLPGHAAWRELLERSIAQGAASGELRLRADAPPLRARGYACGPDATLVLLGGDDQAGADVEWLRDLMPLFVSLFRQELAADRANVQAKMAHDAAARASALVELLDRARRDLEAALASARESRTALGAANERLRAQTSEMELANEQLREQANALEVQALELEIQSDELRITNIALDEARCVAEAASQAKSDFLATMSHELRTPLNAIGGHTQLLQMELHGPVTEQQQAALARIDRSQRHLLGLINDVLNLARIEAGRVEYSTGDVALGGVLEDLMPMIEPQLQAKRIAFVVSDAINGVVVRADRDKLVQVLLNLLSNAQKFTQEGGHVRVDVDGADSGMVAVHVTDDGCGIAANKLEYIFEPFTQVDARPSRQGQGTGLGLAISRDLARGMHGDLHVRSHPGEGSVFTLWLQPAAGRVSLPDDVGPA